MVFRATWLVGLVKKAEFSFWVSELAVQARSSRGVVPGLRVPRCWWRLQGWGERGDCESQELYDTFVPGLPPSQP